MAWSIVEIARMARTTSRTLRHYHAIGLLEPARIGENGYRYYEREQLLRLQQILLLRELGLDLPTIADILAGQQDPASALRAHQQRITREQRRLERLQRTLDRTLAHIERGDPMPAEDYFDAFGEKQQAHEQELVDRLGDGVKPHIEESRQKLAGWSKGDFDAAMADWREGLERLAARLRAGDPAGAPAVQQIIANHRAWLSQFWTPDAASYVGLGEMYAVDGRFRDQIDAIAPGLASYLRDAIAIYVDNEMR